MSGQLHILAALHPCRECLYLVKRTRGGLQNWSGQFGELKFFYYCGELNPWSYMPQPSHHSNKAFPTQTLEKLKLIFTCLLFLATGKIEWSSSKSTRRVLAYRCRTVTGRCFWTELKVTQAVTLPTLSAVHCLNQSGKCSRPLTGSPPVVSTKSIVKHEGYVLKIAMYS